ncbi:MAG: TAXI family TRAP transporter solute-binding subunit [Reyranella sp.]|uniref:TAXI family TRAP transporter solute-binding subunit n=1 Tax=Reyranella sp. TaxID=1929291 RepID=UPI003D1276A1
MLCRMIVTTSVLAAAVLGAGSAGAQDVKLPETLTLTAYDTGTSGFNIAVAVGKVFKEKYKSDLRVLPAGNDIARLAPVKGGRAQASAMGIGGYFASEGVFEFAIKEWGPQPLRLLLSAASCNGITLNVAKDTGVKEVKDLKGKRIGSVVGSPALNQNAYAILAFGNLTKSDVKFVEFSSFGAMWKGMINNEVDAAIASTITGQVRELETSPRGVVMPPTPASDKAGWERMQKIGPYFYPHKVTCGAGGLSPTNSLELPTYPYPIFMAYASQKPDLVYSMTKSMIVDYNLYKDSAPGADGLEVKRQILNWVLPYHEGAVKALKEAGVWTAEAQKHNDMLVKRQDTLGKAWAEFNKANPPADKDAYAKAWMAARKTALEKAGMPAVFE